MLSEVISGSFFKHNGKKFLNVHIKRKGYNMITNYSTAEFEQQYTYKGNDLGATWTENATTFRVWVPTAESVSLLLISFEVLLNF